MEEVEVKIPKKVAEEIAKALEPKFKTAEEVLYEEKEKTNLEELRTLRRKLVLALNMRNFAEARRIAYELREELERKKHELKGAFAPSWLYDVEAELGLAEEVLEKVHVYPEENL